MAMNCIEVITSVERRRRWSAADKARLVAAMEEPGAIVTEVVRKAGVDPSGRVPLGGVAPAAAKPLAKRAPMAP